MLSTLNISIVLYKNNLAQITNLLEDIFASQDIRLNTIYLVDNSPDNRLKSLTKLDPRIEYIAAPHNPGYGTAHNLAIKKSIENNVEYHLVVNPDIRFSSTELAKLIKFMQQRSDVGLVMPRVIYPDGKVQHLCKLLPTPFNIFARRFMPRSYINKMNYSYTLQWTGYNKLMQVPYLSGSFMLFRVSDLLQMGSFDERFFMYFEDTDITRRFYCQAKAWFYPDATVTHEHNQESYRSLKMFWVHIQNMSRYFNKYGWLLDNERRQINKRINSQRAK